MLVTCLGTCISYACWMHVLGTCIRPICYIHELQRVPHSTYRHDYRVSCNVQIQIHINEQINMKINVEIKIQVIICMRIKGIHVRTTFVSVAKTPQWLEDYPGGTLTLWGWVPTAKLQPPPPPYLDKEQPLLCYPQIYSPLFSWVPKDSPWRSTVNDEFSILHL